MGAPLYNFLTSTIAISGTTGSSVSVPDYAAFLGVELPGTLTSCTMKLQVSHDNSNWFDLYDAAGNLVPYWAANTGSRALGLADSGQALPWQFVRPVLSAVQGQGAVSISFVFKKPYSV